MKKVLTIALGVVYAASAFSQSKQVPYVSGLFQDLDWKVINVLEGTSTWEDNDYARDFKGTGYDAGKEYHYDRKNPADDWLISPAIHLEAGKEYKVSFWLDAGDMENFRLCWAQSGTIEDLSAEGRVLYDFEFTDWDWNRISKVIVPQAEGDYYFGFHAYSKADKNNIELTGFEVKENVFRPAAPVNLSVVPDVEGRLEAVVSWTLPTKDSDGADLPAGAVFDKIEIYRDGTLIQTLAGDALSFTDTESLGLTAGKHIYGVSVTVNGITSALAEIESRYIGPLASFNLPWTAGLASIGLEDFQTYYSIVKGDKSQLSASRGWSLKSGYIQFYPAMYSCQDDWLMLPKVKFDKAGIYRIRTTAEYKETSKPQVIEIYKGAGKSIGQMTEKLGEFAKLPSTKGEAYVAFEITEPGEYHLGLHAAAEDPQSTKYIKFYEFTIEETKELPLAVSDLKVTVAGDTASLLFTVPAVTNVGRPVVKIDKIEVYRNGAMIGTLTEGVVPGTAARYDDIPETGGVFSYYVIPYIGEAVPDVAPMTVSTSWIGDKTQNLPYDLDFTQGVDVNILTALWEIRNIDKDSYKWSIGSSAFTLSLNDYDGGEADDMLVSPPFNLNLGEYEVVLSIKGGESGFPLVVGFMMEGSDTIAHPQTLIMSGKNSYADYTAILRVDELLEESDGRLRADSRLRGSLAVYANGEYDYDPYNVMIRRVAVTPKNPAVGVSNIETTTEEPRYYDLNGLEVRSLIKGSIYIRMQGGKARKIVAR